MNKNNIKYWRLILIVGLIVWLLINTLQSIFTEINPDEAYYALYGENLAWGYFDHPPMVGLMTYLSSQLFSGLLGVRFMTVLLSCLTIFVIWKIVDENEPDNRKVLLFLTITFSLAMFNVYGFITTADCPLMLFSSLFLLVYQRYLKNSTFVNSCLLGLTMAGMIYSKYHAFLFLGIIVLSNLSLLKKGSFWMSCFIALAALTPHLLWQYNNDFPSLQYHLISRNNSFKWIYLIEYIPNQMLIFNPFTFGALVYVLIKRHPIDKFERGMYFLIIGFFIFFLAMTIRGHVEPHWTVVCSIPVAIILYRQSIIDKRLRKYIKYVLVPSLFIILALRVLITTPYSPESLDLYGKEKYYSIIHEEAGYQPVVFTSSFQHPSLYHFFTGKEATTLSNVHSRKTQFDIWQKDVNLQNRQVFVCTSVDGKSKEYKKDNVSFYGFHTDKFQSVNPLQINFNITNQRFSDFHSFRPGDTIFIDFTITNPTKNLYNFRHDEFPVKLKATYINKEGTAKTKLCVLKRAISVIQPNSVYKGQLRTVVPLKLQQGNYHFGLFLDNTICISENSKPIKLSIVN